MHTTQTYLKPGLSKNVPLLLRKVHGRRSFSHVSVHLITLQAFQDGISHNLERQLYTFCFCKVLLDSWIWHRTLPLRWWDVKKKGATKRSGLRWFVQMNAVTNTQPVPPCDLGKHLGFDGMGWDTAATSNSVLGFHSNLQDFFSWKWPIVRKITSGNQKVCGDDIGFSDLRSTLQSKAPLYEALDKYHRITQIIRRVVSNLRYPDISRYIQIYPDISRYIQIYPGIAKWLWSTTWRRCSWEGKLGKPILMD